MNVSISNDEYEIYRTGKWLRCLKPDYPRDINSGKPIREFVSLADKCRTLGLKVIPHRDIEKSLEKGEPVVKFGQTDIHSDLNTLSRYKNEHSEWNIMNLEKVISWTQYVNPKRRLWNFCIDVEEDLKTLKLLFSEHDVLFIKTVTKGFAGFYHRFDALIGIYGDLSKVSFESKNIIVSEVIDIKKVEARMSREVVKVVTDEWRHFVYKNRVISSIHAFDCDERDTDRTGYEQNHQAAKQMVGNLSERDFASTYVLDTCTLSSGDVEVIEVNNFFSSGIYSRDAIRSIAQVLQKDAGTV